jgi:DAK2 domain fusion protein YloV
MPDRLDAATLRRAMEIFAESLRTHREELNSLNVYPVPDGDTGTNLLMTQEAVVAALPPAVEDDMLALGAAIARASLMAARGNSGVILSQILRGLCEDPPHDGAFDGKELAAALGRGAEEARRAVARPADGTILTVMRDAAQAAAEAAGDDGDCVIVVGAALREARSSLTRTKELLPELRRSGVVDAGGKGVVLLLDSIEAALAGTVTSERVGPLGPVGQMVDSRTTPELEFEFEVQYLLEAPDEAVAPLRAGLARLGDSVVVVGGNSLFNVHVHTNEADRAVELGVAAGTPKDVQIADLKEQVVDCIGGQARAVRVAEQDTALVAVAEGDGVAEAFASLGAMVVRGGPSEIPSVDALIEAIQADSAPAVVLLTNHPTVTPTAERAAARSAREVLVLGTPSIPSGLAAATAFNPLASVQANMTDMGQAVEACGWAELAPAERDASTQAGSVRQGEWVGTARGSAACVGASPSECAVRLVRGLVGEDSEVITLIEGKDASPDERRAVQRALEQAFPGLDLEVLDGGQPHSPFLIGVE